VGYPNGDGRGEAVGAYPDAQPRPSARAARRRRHPRVPVHPRRRRLRRRRRRVQALVRLRRRRRRADRPRGVPQGCPQLGVQEVHDRMVCLLPGF